MYSTPSTPGGALAAGYAPGSPFSSVRSDRSRGAVMPARSGAAEQHMQLVRQELNESLDAALQKRRELIQTLDQLTHKQGQQGTVDAVATAGVPVGLGSSYDQPMSRAAVENLDQIDWRVARMMYCLDPKYNAVLDPAIAFEIQQKKAEDGQAIQKELSSEAIVAWERKMRHAGLTLPVQERVVVSARGGGPQGLPFNEVNPSYEADQDIWGRTLGLRTLQEALHGDVSQPMPRPVLFPEEYQNFKQGRYVVDDCPIS